MKAVRIVRVVALGVVGLAVGWLAFASTAAAQAATPIVVPGPVEAEDYVDAVDENVGNQGPASQFVGDADVWPTSGEPGFTIGAVRPGESTTYEIRVLNPGQHSVAIRAASGIAGGTVEARVDGVAIAAPTALGSTGGWWAFESTVLGTASLSSGIHTVEIVWIAGRSNFDRLDIATVDGPFACDVRAGTLQWTDADQSKYWIYRSVDGGGSYQWLGRTLGATSFIDAGPPVGAKYQVHYAGIPRVECAALADPAGAGGSFACVADPATGVILWTAAGQSKYWVYRSTDGATFTWLGRTLGDNAFTDAAPPSGATYQVHYAGIPRTNCTVPGSVAPTPTPIPPTATPVPPTATPVPPTPTSTPIPPTPTPTPEPNCGAAAQQAEDGEPSGRLAVLNDSRAQGGQFAGAPASAADEAAPNPAHRIDFCVDIANGGTYIIDARVLAPDDDSNSFWVGIDDEAPVRWDIEAARNLWVDDVVSAGVGLDPASFALAPGRHTVTFYQADAGVRLDSFELRPLAVDQGVACAGPSQQAESGDLSGSFQITGSAIRANATPFDVTGSIAEYCVSIPTSGFYTLDARTRAETDASSTLQIQVDATTDIIWDAPVVSGWATHRVLRADNGPGDLPVEDLTIALNRGNHIVRFKALESNVGLSSFAFVPTTRPTYTGAPGIPDNPAPLRSVRIEPGDPITDLIISSGPGTEFVFAAGTHIIDNNTGIQPLDGQSFVGEVAADGTLLSVLDGEDRIGRAFYNRAQAKNVTIKSLEIKNFNNGKWDGAVDFDNYITNSSDAGYPTRSWEDPAFWILEDLWVHHNAGDGVEVGSGGRLVNVRSTDNDWLGIGGHGRNIEIIGGELANNAWAANEPDANGDRGNCNWHSGGTKLTRVRELTIRGVHSHDNCGPGIWMDISVNDVLIEDNYVNGNNKAAIYYEISFNATIRNNTVLGSVLIRESWDVTVEDNYVRGGLRIQDENGRRQGEIWRQPPLMRDGRPYLQRYTTFANNTVCSTGENVQSGLATFDRYDTASFGTTLWLNNDHYGSRFTFANLGPTDIATWQAFGFDVEGSYADYASCPATPPQPTR